MAGSAKKFHIEFFRSRVLFQIHPLLRFLSMFDGFASFRITCAVDFAVSKKNGGAYAVGSSGGAG